VTPGDDEPAGEAALAAAIAAGALDHAVVVRALLDLLDRPQATLRLRSAERIARMAGVAAPVVDALARSAAGDVDLRVRAAAARALRAHGLAAPDEASPGRRRARRGSSV
jgi:hypothetical protein